ncbi:hypothetical protein BC938DRAFT_482534 [Jimgerdemannia flammicorona]|uniref:Uncharacterized protein n=1 Tax=Jimgerdemannia flammicorona TaxID=994334 RepID=A0A433QDT6_9FUNG|nr:hypothetical protein BC938DRAFT_482534 [Jimgerdemannia flammicorona]
MPGASRPKAVRSNTITSMESKASPVPFPILCSDDSIPGTYERENEGMCFDVLLVFISHQPGQPFTLSYSHRLTISFSLRIHTFIASFAANSVAGDAVIDYIEPDGPVSTYGSTIVRK